MTRRSRLAAVVSLVAVIASGCSTISGGRPSYLNRWRTMASNGGNALPTETGPPESRVAADLGDPETISRSEGKISGRVLDPEGRPVPNAEVRLADGSSRIGRDLRATTDAAGGFTLHGLRPGTSYQLVAEGDSGRDALVGRASARAPSSKVKILLREDDTAPDEAEVTPPRKKVSGASNRANLEESDPESNEEDPCVDVKPRTRVNESDLPPADEIPPNEPEATPDSPAPPRGGKAGWKSATEDGITSTSSAPVKIDRDTLPIKTLGDEGPNPLPPAKERLPGPLAPPTVEPAISESVPEKAPDTSLAPVDPAVPKDTSPGDTSRPLDAPPSSLPVGTVAIPAETSPKRLATWSDLSTQPAEAPQLALASSLPRSTRRFVEKPPEPKSNRSGLLGLKGGSTPKDANTIASCQFDTKKSRIVDFTLPDLDGNPTSFLELDADYVLIDFWGSWCKPCVESIPHLVQLQSKYGPKTLRVIGVATEAQGDTTTQKVQKVDQIARSLSVNYPLLLSEADGKPCPLQQALNIKAFPTMILVDRSGHIIWRDSGAEGATLSRLDRVIAAKTDTGVIRR